MPTFDGGHYFLTVLAPIRTGDLVHLGDDTYRSHAQMLRDTLACLPTARQAPPTLDSPLNSPFARSRRTHLCRFVVIDDVVYNGRNPTDAILGSVKGVDLLEHQPVDRLNAPYLLFAADFDAASGADSELRSFLTELWSTMETELRAVFEHCVGFDRVNSAQAFGDYIKRCQVETTMPFNDYWTSPLPVTDLDLKPLLAPALIGAAVTLIALVLWILGIGGWPWSWITLAGVAATAVSLWVAYRRIMNRGGQPFPTAPNSDLRSILKALYLQQRFVDFAIANQGAEPAALQAAFGRFLEEHKPGDLDAPTQEPGVIRS